GLGLGYTATAALENPRVRSMLVVDAMAPVIEWHQQELLPESVKLVGDDRTRLVLDDFFAMAASDTGFDPDDPGRRFDAVLLDIDHTPRHVLHTDHASFYSLEGLRQLKQHLKPGGVFALWSDDPPDDDFNALLAQTFDTYAAH